MNVAGWERVPFDAALIVQSDGGRRLAQSEYLPSGALPVVDQGDGLIGGFTNNTALAYSGPLPVIVFGDHTRRFKLVDFPFAVGAQGVKILRAADGWNIRFLLYALRSAEFPDLGYSRHFQYLRKVVLPKPSLAVQSNIVAEIERHFTRLDAGVEGLKRLRAHLRRYRAAVLKAACNGRIAVSPGPHTSRTGPKIREQDLPSARRAKWASCRPNTKYKEPRAPIRSATATIPEGWSLVSLDQVALIDVGFAFRSSDFVAEGHGVRLLRGENIEPGALRWHETKCLPESKARGCEHLLLDEGDIILAMDRPVVGAGLKVARVRPCDLPCLLVQRVARIRPLNPSLSDYVYAVLQSPDAITHLLAGQTGTQLPHISGVGISTLSFALPPAEVRSALTTNLDGHLTFISSTERVARDALMRASRLRHSILQRACSGALLP